MRHLFSATALCLSLAAVPALARGETESDTDRAGEAIVVTAQAFVEGEISKSDTPLIRTPLAISIVTAEQIRDRGITDLNDALRSVAGVSRSSTYGYCDAYTIRGYDTAYDSLHLDGLITSSAAAPITSSPGSSAWRCSRVRPPRFTALPPSAASSISSASARRKTPSPTSA